MVCVAFRICLQTRKDAQSAEMHLQNSEKLQSRKNGVYLNGEAPDFELIPNRRRFGGQLQIAGHPSHQKKAPAWVPFLVGCVSNLDAKPCVADLDAR